MKNLVLLLLLALLAPACGDDGDPLSSGGKGTAIFTTWGEEFIEEGIPAGGDGGFVDGWSVKYSKFLVVFGSITVADGAGAGAASFGGTKLVDNTKPGVKRLVSFADVPAKAYERVGYQIKPADASTELLSAEAADKDFMIQNGYSLYVEGTATKGGVSKSFKWGFAQTVTYSDCKAEQGGKSTLGIVVTNGGSDTSELTTHGDHLFYDRLQADPTGAIPTNLRFEAIAAADADGNNEVTFDELAKAPIDLKVGYDPTGFPATNMKEFVTQLSRSVGHYRGEGECSIK